MQLELPYIMNVILYVENINITTIPLLNKKCKRACDAMRINPWFHWSKYPKKDIKNIMKTFPRLETLRIDYESLQIIQNNSFLDEIKMVEIVKDNEYKERINNENLQNKFTQSYNGIITQQTKKVYTYKQYLQILQTIKNFPNVSFIQISFGSSLSENDILLINDVDKSIKIQINLKFYVNESLLNTLLNSFSNNVSMVLLENGINCVVPFNKDTSFCLNPLFSTNTMYQYEKYYLPSTITINHLINMVTNLTYFHYVQRVNIMNETIGGHKQLQLPTSTKIIDIDSSNTSTRFFLQITNWSELTNIEHIFDYDNFDIPFPQIKYQQSKIQKKQRIVFQIFWKYVCIIFLSYLVLPFFKMATSILFHLFDLKYLSSSIYSEMIYLFYLISFISLIFILYLVTINFNPKSLVHGLLFLIFDLSIFIYALSLHYYQSIYWISIMSVTSLPLLIHSGVCCLCLLNETSINQILNYVKLYLRGVKFSKWVENKVKYYVEYWENPLILTFVVFPFEIYVGLIISFVNTNGFISYVCLSLVILLLVIVTTKFL